MVHHGTRLVYYIRDIYAHVHVLAKALYDNTAEAPDELAFRKGDIVTVLEQNTGGLEGWWLCSLNGRQGIAPGNRLKLLAGIYESPNHPITNVSPHKNVSNSSGAYMSLQANTGLSSTEDYDIPPARKQAPNASSLASPQQKQGLHVSPTHHGRTTPPGHELYDTPPSVQRISPNETYDVPPRAFGSGESLNSKSGQSSPKQENIGEIYDTPPCKRDVPGQNTSTQDVYDIPPSSQKMKDEKFPSMSTLDSVDTYDIPPSQQSDNDLYDVIPPLKGGPMSPSPVELYDTLPQRTPTPQRVYETQLQKDTSDLYDVPPNKQVQPDELYDTPARHGHELYDQPPAARGLRPQPGSTQRRISDHVYDIPPTVTQDRPLVGPVTLSQHHRSADDITDGVAKLSLPQLSKSADCIDETLGRRLNLDRDAAMDLLIKRQQALDSAVAYMLSYVSSTWRHQNNLEPHIHEIRAACNQLKLIFKEFMEFCDGVLVNALYVSDQNLHEKLSKQYKPIQDEHQVLTKASAMLDELNWDVNTLMYKPGSSPSNELDTFAVTARGLPDDVKRFVVFVQGNSSLLFKRAGIIQNRPLPTPPPNSAGMSSNWMAAEKETLVTTAPIQATRETIRNRPLPLVPSATVAPQQQIHAQTNGNHIMPENGKMPDYGYVQKPQSINNRQIIITTDQPPVSPPLSPGDQQLLTFYYTEVETLFTALHNAIDLFFSCIDGNQPPKVFVAHSKHIILLGHKLVFVGDTLHHNLHNLEVKNRIIHHSDSLCDCLNVSVNATKNAALQFPAVQPLQEMVDRITDVASASRDLKEIILLNTPA
ncbi:enhancer of filamentation 1-like isoform X2 [Lytechinus variegatus]|uniref:enhancer of filamentation 1-like isoform X2 n=1 Tax=Lytechinus variegatus TaxID=7654 RepID=UPI001BB11822|nr:enhancer of filamentation 1-like isoform X2 [Lytechinus variegatus]